MPYKKGNEVERKEDKISRLSMEMIQYYEGDPRRIQHFLKVHALSRLIALGENLDAGMQFTLEAAALVHDIGIKPAEEKYGQCGGKLQEKEGPPEAEKMLTRLGFDKEVTERVCYLVGHHHTYQGISGDDYRILVEADFLVNLYEDGVEDPAALRSAYEKIFVTETGKKLFQTMYGGKMR